MSTRNSNAYGTNNFPHERFWLFSKEHDDSRAPVAISHDAARGEDGEPRAALVMPGSPRRLNVEQGVELVLSWGEG